GSLLYAQRHGGQKAAAWRGEVVAPPRLMKRAWRSLKRDGRAGRRPRPGHPRLSSRIATVALSRAQETGPVADEPLWLRTLPEFVHARHHQHHEYSDPVKHAVEVRALAVRVEGIRNFARWIGGPIPNWRPGAVPGRPGFTANPFLLARPRWHQGRAGPSLPAASAFCYRAADPRGTTA